jgi:hypothetical protein
MTRGHRLTETRKRTKADGTQESLVRTRIDEADGTVWAYDVEIEARRCGIARRPGDMGTTWRVESSRDRVEGGVGERR